MTLKHLIFLLLLMFFVFTIYAVVSNIVASNNYKNSLINTNTEITTDINSY